MSWIVCSCPAEEMEAPEMEREWVSVKESVDEGEVYVPDAMLIVVREEERRERFTADPML